MCRFVAATTVVAFALGVAACGSDYGSSTPTGPTNTPPAGAVIINIVAENGSQSFSPNPATIPAGQIVAWHNTDRQTHRVVLNDGRLDTGNLAPDAYSQPMTLNAPGPYHCSIHPDMVGTIVSN